MEINAQQKRKGILLEIKDMLTSAAFPFLIQIFLSASIIMFADYSGEKGLQVFVLLFGEVVLMVAYFIFGKQNGVSAYRRTVQNRAKREIEGDNLSAWLKVGDYALWKGVVIGIISVIPFMLIELINCAAPNSFCEVVLKYGFGWAEYPFIVIGGEDGNISSWLNFIWIVFPVGMHTFAYYFGANKEAKKQAKVDEVQEYKKRK